MYQVRNVTYVPLSRVIQSEQQAGRIRRSIGRSGVKSPAIIGAAACHGVRHPHITQFAGRFASAIHPFGSIRRSLRQPIKV